jgi:hypothetical protein
MTMKHAAVLVALSFPGAFVAQPAPAQFVDPTPPNSRTMGNPPTFTDTPALGVPVEGRAAAEDLYPPYDYDEHRFILRRPRPRVYIDPN